MITHCRALEQEERTASTRECESQCRSENNYLKVSQLLYTESLNCLTRGGLKKCKNRAGVQSSLEWPPCGHVQRQGGRLPSQQRGFLDAVTGSGLILVVTWT
jgi:hypothetical protein